MSHLSLTHSTSITMKKGVSEMISVIFMCCYSSIETGQYNLYFPPLLVNPLTQFEFTLTYANVVPLQRPASVWSVSVGVLSVWTQSELSPSFWIIPQMLINSNEHWSSRVCVLAGKENLVSYPPEERVQRGTGIPTTVIHAVKSDDVDGTKV